MANYLERLWSGEVRAVPVLAGMAIFVLLSVVRQWTKFHYIPSYFILFPMSVLDTDVARLYGEGPFDILTKVNDKQRLKRIILIKSTISTLLTFVIIPALVGSITALFMRPLEVATLLAALLLWQGYNAVQSTLDNAVRAYQPKASVSFFVALYTVYLFFLGSCLWKSYQFVLPFVLTNNFAGLILSIWESLFTLLFVGVFVGILGNVIAFIITDQEVLISAKAKKRQPPE